MTLQQINRLYIEGEIHKLSSGEIKDFLLASLDRFPDYFWEVPASVSKYHYPDEREKGGLVLHVRRLCKLVEDVVRMHGLNFWERDVLIAACIVHDSFARGIPPNIGSSSDPLHPVYPEYMLPYNTFGDSYIKDKRVYDEIMECVASHSGRFSPVSSLQSNRKLPMLFHMVDYIGSRNYIKIEI